HCVTSSPQGEDFKFVLSISLPFEGKVAPKATDEVEKQEDSPLQTIICIIKHKKIVALRNDFYLFYF
ncbi:MAG: hypothetical protein IJS47_00180, partial [Clostridia bacterium]|nr:hypothetical protein [Clostridia bacterium]